MENAEIILLAKEIIEKVPTQNDLMFKAIDCIDSIEDDEIKKDAIVEVFSQLQMTTRHMVELLVKALQEK